MAVYWRAYVKGKKEGTAGCGVYWYSFVYAGRRIQESAKTTRKTIAVEAEKNRRKELQRAYAGLPTGEAKLRVSSVRDIVKPYRDNYDLNHRPQSVAFAKGRLAHIERLLGAVLLPNLTEQRIREYIRTRLSEDACGRTINMELGELSRAMGRTWRELWPKVRKLEERKDVGHALSTEEEQRLLRAAREDESPNRNPMLYTFLRIALATGMRSGEIISLRWEQVDLGKRVLTVGRAKTAQGTGRQIPMNGELKDVLDSHALWFFKKFGEIRPEWYVFPGRVGRPQKETSRPFDVNRPCSTIKTSWNTIRKKAGIQCRLHDLRHTAATKMAEAGVPESTMLAIMGHMSRAMLERYSHIRLEAKRQAVEVLTTITPEGDSNPFSTVSTTVHQNATIQ
jgi:integrase